LTVKATRKFASQGNMVYEFSVASAINAPWTAIAWAPYSIKADTGREPLLRKGLSFFWCVCVMQTIESLSHCLTMFQQIAWKNEDWQSYWYGIAINWGFG
jgi:hypothetical protein